MIASLGELMQLGFAVAVHVLLPAFVIAATAAILVGLLLGLLGLRDNGLGQIVRALALLLALGSFADQIAAELVSFAEHSWSRMVEVE